MNIRVAIVLLLLGLPPVSGLAQEKASAGKVRKVKIKTVEGLRFEPVRFSAKPGETIELTLENHDPNDQPHNFVLSQPGSLKEIQEASMVIGPDSVKNGFIPSHDAILTTSTLLNPEESEVLTFTIPDKKGIYPYICTFPGHALVMYGALYVDTKIRGDLAYDSNIPELVRVTELEKLKAKLAVERPSFLRLFMPNAGPAAIAVALPEGMNYCWDAGNCRLRYAWSGGFVDATRMWNSNGNALANLLGDEFWKSQAGESVYGIQFGGKPPERVEFRGYELVGGIPAFDYEVDGVAVREFLSNRGNGLSWTFKIDAPPGEIRLLAPESETAELTSASGSRDGNFWVIPQKEASEFTLTISPK